LYREHLWATGLFFQTFNALGLISPQRSMPTPHQMAAIQQPAHVEGLPHCEAKVQSAYTA
jgi:hypothetical protein